MASTTFVDGETLIEASWLNDVNEAIYNPAAAIIPASSIVNTPNTGAGGNIAATDVQAALNELDTEKVAVASIGTTVQAWNAQLDALALLSTGTASGNIPLVGTKSATESLAGLVELATSAEAVTGTDTTRAVTPAGVAAGVAASAVLKDNGMNAVGSLTLMSSASSVYVPGTTYTLSGHTGTWRCFKEVVAGLTGYQNIVSLFQRIL